MFFFSPLTIIVLLFTHSRVIILICIGMRTLLVIKHDYVFKGADSSDSKESACNAGDLGSIPGSGRCPEEVNGNPFQCSCLENPMDREAWWAIAHGVAMSQTLVTHSNINTLTFQHLHFHFMYLNRHFSELEFWLPNAFTPVYACYFQLTNP